MTGLTYRQQLQYHILPLFKGRTIEKITTADVQTFFNQMGDDVTTATKNKARSVLNMIFNQALDDGFITKNPLDSRSLRMDDTPMAISYVGTCTITLWGTPMTVEFMRTYKMANIKDLEKTKKIVAALENGDALKITFIPGSDKTQIDTIIIPASLLQHG